MWRKKLIAAGSAFVVGGILGFTSPILETLYPKEVWTTYVPFVLFGITGGLMLGALIWVAPVPVAGELRYAEYTHQLLKKARRKYNRKQAKRHRLYEKAIKLEPWGWQGLRRELLLKRYRKYTPVEQNADRVRLFKADNDWRAATGQEVKPITDTSFAALIAKAEAWENNLKDAISEEKSHLSTLKTEYKVASWELRKVQKSKGSKKDELKAKGELDRVRPLMNSAIRRLAALQDELNEEPGRPLEDYEPIQ